MMKSMYSPINSFLIRIRAWLVFADMIKQFKKARTATLYSKDAVVFSNSVTIALNRYLSFLRFCEAEKQTKG